MAEGFPNLMKFINLHIQEAQTPTRISIFFKTHKAHHNQKPDKNRNIIYRTVHTDKRVCKLEDR